MTADRLFCLGLFFVCLILSEARHREGHLRLSFMWLGASAMMLVLAAL